jgi:hypothetical protein
LRASLLQRSPALFAHHHQRTTLLKTTTTHTIGHSGRLYASSYRNETTLRWSAWACFEETDLIELQGLNTLQALEAFTSLVRSLRYEAEFLSETKAIREQLEALTTAATDALREAAKTAGEA